MLSCSALTNKLMVRVTNYFDTQIRIPIPNGILQPPREAPNGTSKGSRTAFKAHLDSASSDKPLTPEQMLSWYGKILDGVKQRYRKLQRLTR